MPKKLFMTESVVINASAEELFDYVADSENDPKWRTEVDRMDAQGEIKEGTVVIEYSSFYKIFHTVTPTEIKQLNRPSIMVMETPDTHPTWLRSIRTFEPIDDSTSTFIYELGFTLDSMRQISPIIPPAKLVSLWYTPRIQKYLLNLKSILEHPD